MSARGFTLIELAIVTSIFSILVPVVFMVHAGLDRRLRTTRMQAEAAGSMRELTESVRADLRVGSLLGGTDVRIRRPCGEIVYIVEGLAVVRRAPAACGGDRVVVRGVEALERNGSLVSVRFTVPDNARVVTLVMGVVP